MTGSKQIILRPSGLLKTSKLYIDAKKTLRAYEKKTEVHSLSSFKRVVHFAGKSGEEKGKIPTFLAGLMNDQANTIEAYYDGENTSPAIVCSYTVIRGLFNKSSLVNCRVVARGFEKHTAYYVVSLAVKHNIISPDLNSYLETMKQIIKN